MASTYPGGLDSFDTIASDKKTSDTVGGRTHRDMHNDLGDAIEAVQTELGTTPSGSESTVAARLDKIEDGTRLAANSVGATQLADSAVDTAAIQDGAVTSAKIADGTIVATDVAASTFAAFGTVGNLLTANQASGTDTLGDTTGWSAWQSTLSSTTFIQKSGTRCLVVTPTGTDAAYAFTSDRMAVTAGVTYTFTAALRSDAGTGETGRIRLEWYDAASGGTYLGESAGTTVTLNSSAWQVSTLSAVVPADATHAAVQVYRAAGAVGVPMYVDEVGIWKGAGGQWAMPGVVITDTGIRPNPSNTSEVQIWNDATATWITV